MLDKISSSIPRLKKNYLKKFGSFIGQHEKVILALLAVVIVISGTFWFRQYSGSNGSDPSSGGSYVEGVVGDANAVHQIATRLTKTGLFSYDQDGRLVSQLINGWQVDSTQSQFTFDLKPEIDENEIVSVLDENQSLIGPAEISADSHKLSVNLANPNPNLPIILAEPLFNYGPYKLGKATQKTTIFTRNPRSGSVKPYLNKIIVQTYANNNLLQQALAKSKVDGAVGSSLTVAKGYSVESIELPRYYAVLFNLNKSPFRDSGLRKSLIEGSPASPSPFTLTVADQEPYKSLATQQVERWQSLGAKVTLEVKPIEEIQEKIEPTRNFQALLTGVDYSNELDPYYLWHSSQVRPPDNNLTGEKSLTVDKILDSVRATTDMGQRKKLIGDLHAQLTSESVALFIQQQADAFILSNQFSYQPPVLPVTLADRYQSIAQWYLK